MTYELANGVSLGAVEDFNPQHSIHSQGLPAISKLAIELQWHLKTPPNVASNATSVSRIRAPLVRGAPYTSMIYEHATPRIYVARSLSAPIVVDNDPTQSTLVCGDGKTGKYSAHPVLVRRELKIQFDTSDMSWLVFVSEPMEFVCSQYDAARDVVDMDLPPGVLPPSGMHSFFDLRAVRKVQRGMVRVAMANNCTTGQNPQCKWCGQKCIYVY
ncbi:hypothetical protein EON64_13170 [archaeon]|nr:MAG: hypothetical protein EON64_13170 [archaeon]